MKLWLDAQLSPALVPWLEGKFDVDVLAVQTDSELVTAKDRAIFRTARDAGAVVMTKDRDFVDLVERLGPRPEVLWLTRGNTSNRVLKRILSTTLLDALNLVEGGAPLVERSATSGPRSR